MFVQERMESRLDASQSELGKCKAELEKTQSEVGKTSSEWESHRQRVTKTELENERLKVDNKCKGLGINNICSCEGESHIHSNPLI
jgi:peptidoglycan hydrolase CwlO-like protein